MISVVIPAYNEEKFLPATLRAVGEARAVLLRERGVESEVVVVDNLSTDMTATVARSHDARVLPFDVRNISAVRNAGIREARHAIVVAIDADCGLPAEGLVRVYDLMSAGGHVGGGFGLRVVSEKLFTRVAAFVIQRFVATVAGIEGAVFFFWRDDALAIGGFDESRLVAEDSTFAMALRKHGALSGRRFTLLREVEITTIDRKDTTLATLLPLAWKLLRVFAGQRLTQKDLGYWYNPKR